MTEVFAEAAPCKTQCDKWKSVRCSSRVYTKHSWFCHLAILLWFLKTKRVCWVKRYKTVRQEEHEKTTWEGEQILQMCCSIVPPSKISPSKTQLKFTPEMFLFGYLCKSIVRKLSTIFFYILLLQSCSFVLPYIPADMTGLTKAKPRSNRFYQSPTLKGTGTAITEYLKPQREHLSLKKWALSQR